MTATTKFELHQQITKPNLTPMIQLTQSCDLSVSEIKSAINKGALWLTRNGHTQRLRRVKKTLKPNDELHLYYDASVLSKVTEPAILIEDCQSYSVWYKPYGMLSQGSKWSDHCTITRFAQTHLTPERPVFLVHRLDRAASGLIIVAHTKNTARAFSKIFEERMLDKQYQIICHGKLKETSDAIEVVTPIDNKSAKTTFTLLTSNEKADISLLNAKIDTGRKHQIRKHAAEISLPVVGDRLHGNQEQQYNEALNLQLCAVSLTFDCPVTTQTKTIELPQHLRPNIDWVVEQLS